MWTKGLVHVLGFDVLYCLKILQNDFSSHPFCLWSFVCLFVVFLSLVCFETGSHLAQAGFKSAMQLKMTFNFSDLPASTIWAMMGPWACATVLGTLSQNHKWTPMHFSTKSEFIKQLLLNKFTRLSSFNDSEFLASQGKCQLFYSSLNY